MSYIGSLDQGTTSTRFIIFNRAGQIIGQDQLEHQQILPQAGWVEHDPLEIWQRTQEVIAGAISSAKISASELTAIGITNQRETVVAWDAITGQPFANAIVWQDIRTTELLSKIAQADQIKLRAKTGLRIAPYFSASKIAWLIANTPHLQEAIALSRARIGTIDSWLMWNLSGQHITDVTNASRTMLMNLETLDWDDELLSIFDIPRSVLAEIRPSSQIYGHTLKSGAFGTEIPIAGIVGDQQSAMIGQKCFSKGDSKTTYGTGNFALINTGGEIVHSTHGLLTTVLFKIGDAPVQYALEGSVAVTGSAIQWLRDQLGIISTASDVENLASKVEDSGGVYFVPAFSGLFAPHWRSDARGAIVGLTRAATSAHLARAALEAICYQTREVLDAMATESGITLASMRVDGGITSNKLCMQMQADILGIEITRPDIAETTALGAAFAAGLAVGFWSSIDEIQKLDTGQSSWFPKKSSEFREAGYSQWKKAVVRTLDWVE